ncbi:MAG: type III secretion system export apparatus subunit SctR [Phyllobacteriaceae bacterium]|nr:type III secretion system export apparatus subunit SctR [Phyllobacteriaceae bacterium]
MVALYTIAGLLPLLAVAVTSFAKVSVVLLIVRNAIGIQQTPGNTILYAIALILTFHIMQPVFSEIYLAAQARTFDLTNLENTLRQVIESSEPLRGFLARFADERSVAFFIDSLENLNPTAPQANPNDYAVLIPAFLVSELTAAFQIGFLLYLPFVMIDLVVSAIMIAMGMSMMSPTVISIPLKLLIFVMVDGWSRMIEGLVLSYAP